MPSSTWQDALEAGDYASAREQLESFKRALEIDELFTLGQCHVMLQDYPRAIAPLQQVLAHDPRNAEAYRLLARALMFLERIAEALVVYETGIGHFPDSALLHCGLGLAQRYSGEQVEGIATLRRAAELDPMLHVTWFNLGSALVEIDPGQAIEAAQRAVTLKPEHGESLLLLGEAYLENDDREQAFTALSKGLDRAPYDYRGRLLRGQLAGVCCDSAWDSMWLRSKPTATRASIRAARSLKPGVHST
jgi:protein O-GlcNAc transferase